jgi:hypothetical protein
VLPFVSDPWLSALLLFLVFMGQIVFEKYLVNGIVGNMLAAFMLDYLLKTSCTTILLFVDASTLSKLSLMLISDISE